MTIRIALLLLVLLSSARAASEPTVVPSGPAPALDGVIGPDEWKGALRLEARDGDKGPVLAVHLRHDAKALYAAFDAPFACTGSEEIYVLIAPAGETAMPGPADFQASFNPFSVRRLPWKEAKGDGKSWVDVAAPSGWTAAASAAGDRLHIEVAVALARLPAGEKPAFRLGLLMAGGASFAVPEKANLFTPSSWLAASLAGPVAAEPSKRDAGPALGEALERAKQARAAFDAAQARREELMRRREPPKTQQELVAIRQGMEAAVQSYARAAELEPTNPLLHFARGSFHAMLGDDGEARASLEAAHRLAPGVSRIAVNLVEVCKRTNAHARALALAEAEAARHPEAGEPKLMRAELRMALEDFDGAVEDLEAVGKLTLDAKNGQMVDALTAQAKSLREGWKAETEARRRDAKADLPRAEIVTGKGRIVVELFEDDAPNTVANFVSLADKGYFDGMRFHRVIGDFMAQAGDPFSRNPEDNRIGSGGPGYRIKTQTGARRHFRGTLSMANAGPDTDGSQFFITVRPTPHLDGKHAVFGRVLEGQEVVDSVQQGDLIKSVKILRKRSHPYEPEKLEAAPAPPAP